MSWRTSELEFSVSGHGLQIAGARRNEFLRHPDCQFSSLTYDRHRHRLFMRQQCFEDALAARPRAGLLPALEFIAQSANFDYVICRNRLAQLGVPQAHTLDIWPPKPTDPALMHFLANRERGIVNCAPCVDVSWCIAQVAASFPRAKLAVVVSSRKRVSEVSNKLREFLCDLATETYLNNADRLDVRIAVGVVGDFTFEGFDIERRDILIFPTVHDALHIRAQDLFLAPDIRCRVFGFLSSEQRVSWGEWQRFRGAFGFDEIAIPAHGVQNRDVFTIWRHFTGACMTHTDNRRRILQYNVWYNASRNRFIARLARRSQQELADFKRRSRTRTVVVTDSLNHALALRKYLPNWPVVASDEFSNDGLTLRERDAIVGSSGSCVLSGDCYISTTIGLNSFPHWPNTLLIWAGSGAVGPELPSWLPNYALNDVTEDGAPELFLLDIVDKAAPLRRWARLRRDKYIHRGTVPIGMTPIECRVRFFVDRLRSHQ